jgi:hypothetical protein
MDEAERLAREGVALAEDSDLLIRLRSWVVSVLGFFVGGVVGHHVADVIRIRGVWRRGTGGRRARRASGIRAVGPRRRRRL